MSYLVTGATGFLGGHLARTLSRRGEDVVAVGRNSLRCAELRKEGIPTSQCDLSDPVAVAEAFRRVDVVFHVAALSTPWGAYSDFYAANVTASKNVVTAALRLGVRRLVLVSTPSVTLDDSDQIETSEMKAYPKQFLSHYQATKKMAEDIVNRASGDMETVIVRPKAIFGPDDQSLVPRLIVAAKANRLRQIGDGLNLVDLTYVTNVVDALMLAADAKTANGRTYTVTNGDHVPLWPIIRRTIAAAGYRDDLRVMPIGVARLAAGAMERIANYTKREPHLTRYTVAMLGLTQTYSIEAARRDLGYHPAVSVEQGIEAVLSSMSKSRHSAWKN